MDTKLKKCSCEKETEEEKYIKIDQIIDRYKDREGNLIQVLHLAQSVYGYLPTKLQEYIAKGLNAPLNEVYGVVTFYSIFSTIPRGENTVKVCMGTACYVKGAQELVDGFEEKLEMKVGETTKDSKFTLGVTRCIGACGIAPAIMVNEKVYQRVEVDMIDDIINEYK